MQSTVTKLPMTLARACVEAMAGTGNFRGMSSGWAQDEAKRIEKRICALFGLQPGRVTQGMVEVEIHTSHDGTRRMIIDNDRGYFDHVIAVR